MSETLKSMKKTDIIKWVVTIGLPVLIALIPINELFTWQLKWYLVGTVFVILCWALEVLPLVSVSIALPIYYVFFGICDATVAFSPLTQYIPWMVLSGLIMAAVLERTGLLKRIAYTFICWMGATYSGVIIGLSLTSFIATIFVGTSVLVPLTTLAYGVCIALGTGKSKESCGIMLTTAVVSMTTLCVTFNGATAVIIGMASGAHPDLTLLGFFESIWHNLPTCVLIIAMVLFAIKTCSPEKPIEGKAYFQQKLDEMGKLSLDEIKCAIVLVVFIIFMLTTKYTGLNLTWGLAFVPLLLCAPGIGTVTAQDLQKINYGFIFFICACISIGAVGASLGIGPIISNMILPLVSGQHYYVYFILVWILIFALNFILTPFAIEAAFTVPLLAIGTAIGLNEYAVLYFIACVADQVILPYECAMYLLPFSFGLIKMSDFMKMMSVKTVLSIIITFALLIPWWNFSGFLY